MRGVVGMPIGTVIPSPLTDLPTLLNKYSSALSSSSPAVEVLLQVP